MLQLLPMVDIYLKNATGRDWAGDTEIDPTAKAAAQILISMWYENPGMTGQGITSLSFGFMSLLVQLEAKALEYKSFHGRNGAGSCALIGARIGDTVASLVGLIGATGDQSMAFEVIITIENQIQQISTSDLSVDWFRARLVSMGDLP
jgi:hypothetical protein